MSNFGDNQTHSALVTAVYRILKPLAKFSIQLGLSAGAMNELVRRAYLDAAEEILTEQGTKIQTSRLCAMTGFYRKEVVRLQNLPLLTDPTNDDRYNRSARVISGWLRDKDFQTQGGKPAALKLQGDGSFAELVKRYSGDMTPIAMRQELERLGVLIVSKRDMVKLEASGYLASTDEAAVQILGTDTADLISTIHHNIVSEKDKRRFQRKVAYVSIPDQFVEPFRTYAAEESQLLLEKLDRWLATKDLEVAQENTTRSRLGLGIYHIEKLYKETDQADESPLE